MYFKKKSKRTSGYPGRRLSRRVRLDASSAHWQDDMAELAGQFGVAVEES